MNLRSCEFTLSMQFVMRITRRTTGGNASMQLAQPSEHA
jgi:hypothetical protein